jgi:hypothetical protein
MPLKVEIDHAKRFVTVTTYGRVVLQDILDYFDQMVVENASAYAKLFDASDVNPQLSDADMMVLGARVSAYAAFDPRGPLALVAHDPQARILMRRFMNLGLAQRPAMLFERVKDARVWLQAQQGQSSDQRHG